MKCPYLNTHGRRFCSNKQNKRRKCRYKNCMECAYFCDSNFIKLLTFKQRLKVLVAQ
jgi:hypothetical protein